MKSVFVNTLQLSLKLRVCCFEFEFGFKVFVVFSEILVSEFKGKEGFSGNGGSKGFWENDVRF